MCVDFLLEKKIAETGYLLPTGLSLVVLFLGWDLRAACNPEKIQQSLHSLRSGMAQLHIDYQPLPIPDRLYHNTVPPIRARNLPEAREKAYIDQFSRIIHQQVRGLAQPGRRYAGQVFAMMFERFITGDSSADTQLFRIFLQNYINVRSGLQRAADADGISILEFFMRGLLAQDMMGRFLFTAIVVEEAADSFADNHVDFRLQTFSDTGFPMLLISATDSPGLNFVAKRLRDREAVDAIRFDAYDLVTLGAEASYNPTRNSFFIDLESVVHNKISRLFRHEIRHFVRMHKRLRHRIPDPLYGMLVAQKPEEHPLPTGLYVDAYSPDEAYTHALQAFDEVREVVNGKKELRAAKVRDLKLRRDMVSESHKITNALISSYGHGEKMPQQEVEFIHEDHPRGSLHATIEIRMDNNFEDAKGQPIPYVRIYIREFNWLFAFPLVESRGQDDPDNFLLFKKHIRAQEVHIRRFSTFLHHVVERIDGYPDKAVSEQASIRNQLAKMLSDFQRKQGFFELPNLR